MQSIWSDFNHLQTLWTYINKFDLIWFDFERASSLIYSMLNTLGFYCKKTILYCQFPWWRDWKEQNMRDRYHRLLLSTIQDLFWPTWVQESHIHINILCVTIFHAFDLPKAQQGTLTITPALTCGSPAHLLPFPPLMSFLVRSCPMACAR